MIRNIAKSAYYYARDKHRQVGFLKTKYFTNFVFIHINKTGGSSIEKALGAPLIHKPALEFRKDIGQHRWDKRFSFAIVRNPWDRAVSQYHYRLMINKTRLRQKPLPFDEWVKRVFVERDPAYLDEERMFLTQTDWVADEDGNTIVNFVGRFENLQAAWETICTNLNKEITTLPHVKKSSRGDYRSHYSDTSAEIIESFFKDDIDNFNYRFE